MNHFRIYPPALRVEVTPLDAVEPRVSSVHVFADVGDEPEAGIDIDGVCLVSMTPDGLAALIERLQAAQRDLAAAALRAPLVAVGTEGACEGCALAVRAGESIVIEDADTADRVVLHARCPVVEQQERSN